MNERILQLAKQAGLDDDMFPLEEWDNPELEKFAELIVKECVQVALETIYNRGIGDVQDCTIVGNAVADHFGVKE